MKPECRNQKSGAGVASGLWPDSIGAQRRRYNFAWLVFLLLSFGVATLHAQSYSIDWFTIDGGGGTSTGGVYSVSGTIGQPDGGQTSGGNFTIDGGFWGLIAAVQTVGAPTLTITHSSNSVKVLWPYPSTGWTLQQNPNLTTANWSTSGGISNDGTNNFITITPPTGNLFFRLKQ